MSPEKEAAKPAKPPAEKVEEPAKSCWLILVKDESETPPQCVRCENAESLSRAIQEHVLSSATPLHAFAFEGRRIDISSPRPVCSFRIGDKKINVGHDSDEYDEGGRIVPLAKPGTDE